MIDKAIVEKTIAALEEGFGADGVKVELGAIGADSVTIRLLVTPETCRECMMPVPHLENLFQHSLRKEGIKDIQVRVMIVDDPYDASSV